MMTLASIVSALILAAFEPVLAIADDPTLVGVPGRSAAFRRCIEKAQPSPTGNMWHAFSACQEKELSRLNAKLNRFCRIAKLRLESRYSAERTLVDGERSWISHRDEWCGFEQWNGPTAEYVTGPNCQIDLTEEQLSRVQPTVATQDDMALVGLPGRSANFWRCDTRSPPAGGGSDWSNYSDCQKQELTQLNARLDDGYRSLLSQAKAHGKKAGALADAERSWLTYREKWCAFERLESVAPPNVGDLNCQIDLTEEQLSEIGDQLETLTHSHD